MSSICFSCSDDLIRPVNLSISFPSDCKKVQIGVKSWILMHALVCDCLILFTICELIAHTTTDIENVTTESLVLKSVLSVMRSYFLWSTISSISKSCYSHIRELRCIRPYLDSKTVSTIAASIVHSKLDYWNSLYHNLLKSQINRLQQIQNCLARTVVKAPKSSHITPILRSLHWLKINERIKYKLTKFLQPANLTTYTILSLFSLQVELAPRLLSP